MVVVVGAEEREGVCEWDLIVLFMLLIRFSPLAIIMLIISILITKDTLDILSSHIDRDKNAMKLTQRTNETLRFFKQNMHFFRLICSRFLKIIRKQIRIEEEDK